MRALRLGVLIFGLVLAAGCPGGGAATTGTTGRAAPAAMCAPGLDEIVLARVPWDAPPGEVLVVGRPTGRVEAGGTFERLEARMIVRAGDVCPALALGELTRPLAEGSPLDPVPVQDLGSVDENPDAPLTLERGALPPDHGPVLVVRVRRDVEAGLTEWHAVPVLFAGGRAVAGPRVPCGRDAMRPPVFYSRLALEDVDGDGVAELVLARVGLGARLGRVIFRRPTAGGLVAEEQPGSTDEPGTPGD